MKDSDGPASGAPVAVDERSTERATAESTGTLVRYGVVHRHEPGDPLYSHLPMADGYWTPWHIAIAVVADLESRVRFYEQHTDKQANELVEVTIQRDLLRAALVKLVGVDTPDELEQMEVVMRLMPAPAKDKAATIDAIHALLATLDK